MECSQWNEKGLLFTSGELDKVQKDTFSYHLQECSICKRELEQYEKEKSTYFIPENFEETPSIAIDKEIMRVCSKPRNYTVPHIGFQILFKNTFYALLVLAIGFGGGTYFASLKSSPDSKGVRHSQQGNEVNTIVDNKKNSALHDIASSKLQDDAPTSDSLNKDSLPQTIRRGNLDLDGVHSVTEKQ